MPLQLQSSVATGGISAALVSALLKAAEPSLPIPPVTCQDLQLPSLSSELHWPSLLLGILCGLVLGQLLEACILARQFLSAHLRHRAFALSNAISARARSG